MPSERPEILFYHLTLRPLEGVLPGLLEKCHERSWRTVVQTVNEDRQTLIDNLLWTYSADSFLPHGAPGDGAPEDQPILVTCDMDNLNGASVRFMVDGAEPPPEDKLCDYARVVFLFDGHEQHMLESARRHWKTLKASGFDLTYWQQNDNGGWARKA